MTNELLGYEQLSDYMAILLRLPYMNKRSIEGQLKALNAEYDNQQREKKRK